MIRWFYKLFNISSKEWPRVLILFLMLFMTQIGAIWGRTTAYAAFIHQELEILPWVIGLSAVLSIPSTILYSAFADRINNQRLLLVLYVIITVGIGAGLFLLKQGYLIIGFPLIYLVYMAWGGVFDVHFATYVNTIYDIQSAKRILPFVSAGARTGVIVAGLSMPLVTGVLTPNNIVFVWLLINLAVIVLVLLMPVILGDNKEPAQQLTGQSQVQFSGAAKQEGSYIRSITEGLGYTARSGYLRWITLGVVLLAILFAMIEYRSSGLLLNALGSQESLNNYLALLLGLGNVIVLPMLLFGLNRLIARLGLGNTSLIFPASNLLISSSLVFAPGLASATAAYFNYTTLPSAFYYPINTLFYNAVPLRVRGRARAFVDGLIFPVGLLTGSALLLILPIGVKIRAVTLFIGLLALAFFITSLIIRRQY